jgi:hypothetical protein
MGEITIMRIKNNETNHVGLTLAQGLDLSKDEFAQPRPAQRRHLRRHSTTPTWLIALLLGSSLGRIDPAPPKRHRSPAASDSLTEIVVTARKRNENLIDTPVSVDFLGGDQLQRSGVTNMARPGTEEVPQLHMATFFPVVA